MNIAYSRYLQNALEHSTLTDEEKQGAHAFLKFLSNYKPKGLSLREPDFYGYGDAFGQYGVTYFDKGSLEDNGIDPGKLDALQFDQLMTRWTEEAHDMLGSDGCDIIPDSLDNAIQALGIDRESIEAWNHDEHRRLQEHVPRTLESRALGQVAQRTA